MTRDGGVALGALAGAIVAFAVGFGASGRAAPKAFTPPPFSAIPNSPFGREVAIGRAIFDDPAVHAHGFVGNRLKCSDCHLGEGTTANAGPMWAAYVAYPRYRAKNGRVVTFAQRLQDCFRFSENGKAPPLGGPVLLALESYAYFLAQGAPTGATMAGAGFPELAAPPLKPDFARGRAIYVANCAMCHGAHGKGQAAGGRQLIPPLWGDQSFNWGAGMAQLHDAAGFIRANMPLGRGGSLSGQQAWDVAAFIDGHPRPQDPRFTGSLAETRAKFHNSADSFYGETVNGVRLGQGKRPHSRRAEGL